MKEGTGRSNRVPWRERRWWEAPVLKVFPGLGLGAAEHSKRRTSFGDLGGRKGMWKESTPLTFTQRLWGSVETLPEKLWVGACRHTHNSTIKGDSVLDFPQILAAVNFFNKVLGTSCFYQTIPHLSLPQWCWTWNPIPGGKGGGFNSITFYINSY